MESKEASKDRIVPRQNSETGGKTIPETRRTQVIEVIEHLGRNWLEQEATERRKKMGAGGSKPESSGSSKHVFSSNSPVQFSQGLVESLQTSSETDSSRAKSLELHIQERVAAELERLRERETQTLADLEQRIAAASSSSTSSSSTSSEDANYTLSSQSPLSLDTPLVPFAGRTGNESLPLPSQQDAGGDEVGRESVLKEIANLQSKLEGRRKMRELDSGVEKAKDDVVTCLRLNDRRPLDCWKEVETFKSEVARLERGFVDRIVG